MPLVRLITVLAGSFAFTWGFVALGVASQVALGEDFDEAEKAMMLLAFPVFLPLFLWAFASPRHGRMVAWLVGGAGSMTAAAWALQRAALT